MGQDMIIQYVTAEIYKIMADTDWYIHSVTFTINMVVLMVIGAMD